MNGKNHIDKIGTSSSNDGDKRADEQPLSTSESSEKPSNDSSKLWKAPKNIKEFAAQANLVATQVLNGEIDIDTARTYSAIARTVAQAVNTELGKARITQQEPDTDFDGDY